MKRGPGRFGWRVQDHRGRLWKPARYRLFEIWRASVIRPDLRDVLWYFLFIAVGLVGFWGSFQLVEFLPRSLTVQLSLKVALFLLLLCFFWFAIPLAGTWAMVVALARYWLESGVCAHCRFPIDTVNPSADGCTVCPECGAAWKLNAPLSERVPE